MLDDVIPSNATENRLYGSLSCSSAQHFFYIDTDNIRQAIMILRPTSRKLYIFTERYRWIFHPKVYTYVHLYKTCRFNLVFSPLVTFHVISWSIYMTATFTRAAESQGVHCSWTPPVMWICYLNPRFRIPCLPFSWAPSTADPDCCTAHAKASCPNNFSCHPCMCDYTCTCRRCYVIPYVNTLIHRLLGSLLFLLLFFFDITGP